MPMPGLVLLVWAGGFLEGDEGSPQPFLGPLFPRPLWMSSGYCVPRPLPFSCPFCHGERTEQAKTLAWYTSVLDLYVGDTPLNWNWCPKAQFMAVTALTPSPSLVCTHLKS